MRLISTILSSTGIFIFIMLTSILVHAQTGPTIPPPDANMPLDGGLSFLLAGAIGYLGNEARLYINKKRDGQA